MMILNQICVTGKRMYENDSSLVSTKSKKAYNHDVRH